MDHHGQRAAVDKLSAWVEELQARERRIEQREQAVRKRELAADDRDREASRRELVADERDRLADERQLWPRTPKPPDGESGEGSRLLAWQRRTLLMLQSSRNRMAETAVALMRSDDVIARQTAKQQRATLEQQQPGD